LLSPQLIKDVQNLNFTGGDDLVTYDNRHKGLSIFSLAPLEDYGDEGNIRDRILHYEEIFAQHGPADRAAFESLSSVVVASPTNRDRLLRWVDHADIILTIFLGPSCPLIAPLAELTRLLHNPSYVSGFDVADFLTLLCMLHKAIRRFFAQHTTLALERVIADLAAGAHEVATYPVLRIRFRCCGFLNFALDGAQSKKQSGVSLRSTPRSHLNELLPILRQVCGPPTKTCRTR
jgi:hypothetical protein